MITKEMTPLDVVEQYPETEPVFRTYDGAIGKCLLCHCLFDSLESIAREGELDLETFLSSLEDAVRNQRSEGGPEQEQAAE